VLRGAFRLGIIEHCILIVTFSAPFGMALEMLRGKDERQLSVMPR
jgi:hypothetical protein